ncbi:MAG: hypothetical protein H0X38_00060 [Planctomycetes bacterium]|nr:hypothetical protein [Planctomycetota bacterium]
MAAGADASRWNHTATLMALIANCHRDPKRHRAYTPADFHPDHARESVPRTRDLTVLRDLFVSAVSSPPTTGT